MTTRMCTFPYWSAGSGPIESTLRDIIGARDASVNGDVWIIVVLWSNFWQIGQCLMYCLTFSRILNHGFTFFSANFCSVFSTPLCPATLLCTDRMWRFTSSDRGSSMSARLNSAGWRSRKHSREKASAAMFSSPGICSMSKLYSCIASFQRRTFCEPSWLMYIKFLWSVRSTKYVSRSIYSSFWKANTIANASFSGTDHLSLSAVSDLLRNAKGSSFPSAVFWNKYAPIP